jgi:hypothetical protein
LFSLLFSSTAGEAVELVCSQSGGKIGVSSLSVTVFSETFRRRSQAATVERNNCGSRAWPGMDPRSLPAMPVAQKHQHKLPLRFSNLSRRSRICPS